MNICAPARVGDLNVLRIPTWPVNIRLSFVAGFSVIIRLAHLRMHFKRSGDIHRPYRLRSSTPFAVFDRLRREAGMFA
jgi:hypothetical protein